ncbi:hypothetical protein RCL1_004606 [Eukaryota sp. TZLM3-RCL]
MTPSLSVLNDFEAKLKRQILLDPPSFDLETQFIITNTLSVLKPLKSNSHHRLVNSDAFHDLYLSFFRFIYYKSFTDDTEQQLFYHKEISKHYVTIFVDFATDHGYFHSVLPYFLSYSLVFGFLLHYFRCPLARCHSFHTDIYHIVVYLCSGLSSDSDAAVTRYRGKYFTRPEIEIVTSLITCDSPLSVDNPQSNRQSNQIIQSKFSTYKRIDLDSLDCLGETSCQPTSLPPKTPSRTRWSTSPLVTNHIKSLRGTTSYGTSRSSMSRASTRTPYVSPYTQPLKVKPVTFKSELKQITESSKSTIANTKANLVDAHKMEDKRLSRLLSSGTLHISYFTRDLIVSQNGSKSRGNNQTAETRDDVMLMRKRKLLSAMGLASSDKPVVNQKTFRRDNHSTTQRFTLPSISTASRALSAPLVRSNNNEFNSKEFVKSFYK